MFFELVTRNSRRSRKENGLFFASLLVVIIAFYMILSLSHQDVMIFLAQIESNAVDKLLAIIPVFYGMTLLILFFLIYFASKFQLERRMHEFGVYLMMGMRRWKLFLMLLAEDFGNSIMALLIGLPAAVLLSELVSLITARLVGLGIVGHSLFRVSFSAILWTMIGFLFIKTAAFLILSGKIARKEVGALLTTVPEGAKKEKPAFVYTIAFFLGIGLLVIAYGLAIYGSSWLEVKKMAITLFFGFIGTMLLFFGLRSIIGFMAKRGRGSRRLQTFTFRQLQENVIYESNTLAISSLLMLAALCCFGFGVAITQFYGSSEQHVLDYTFKTETSSDASIVREKLSGHGFMELFSDLFEMKIGYIRIVEDHDMACSIGSVMDLLRQEPDSEEKEVLLNNLSYVGYPHIIALTGYNKLLEHAGLPKIELADKEAAIYMDKGFITKEGKKLLHKALAEKPEIQIAEKSYHLTDNIQTIDLVTDRSITLSFALIVNDETFHYLTNNDYSIYLNAVLSPEAVKGRSILAAFSEINGKLDNIGISYESYLQNIGRQLFYMVAASYITIYLAIIFLVVANTANVVQFLTRQQKTGQRYQTLLKLGASYEMLCASTGRQIDYYFGIPIAVAAFSSIFGVRALFKGLLSSRMQMNISILMWVSIAIILLLCVVECIYILAVKRASSHYILSLSVFHREE